MKSNFILIYRNKKHNKFLQHDKPQLDSFKVLLFNKNGKGKVACDVLDH